MSKSKSRLNYFVATVDSESCKCFRSIHAALHVVGPPATQNASQKSSGRIRKVRGTKFTALNLVSWFSLYHSRHNDRDRQYECEREITEIVRRAIQFTVYDVCVASRPTQVNRSAPWHTWRALFLTDSQLLCHSSACDLSLSFIVVCEK